MAKVTSDFQVAIPKELAEEYGIKPGDEVVVSAAGEAIRIVPAERHNALTAEQRLEMFDASVERQKERERARGKQPQTTDRGWKREDLYNDRGLPR